MPKRRLEGTVVSTKMKDTVVVEVVRRKMHAKYRKFIKSTKRYHAHDAGNKLAEGAVVTIEECAPISKTKSWMVVSGKKEG